MDVVMSGTGIYTPKDSISTQEIVDSYNIYVDNYNENNSALIIQNEKERLSKSNVDFIINASGIHKRYVFNKAGILDPNVMRPIFPNRKNEEQSIQCEMAVLAAKEALSNANKTVDDIDAVIVACSNLQRPYPSIAIEVQSVLGIKGFAYDLNAACSSASFGINVARNHILSENAKCVLNINPELYTAHVNFRDRTSHFIFGDGCSASIIEAESQITASHPYKILSGRLQTQFSNNIRNNFGFLNRCEQSAVYKEDKLFTQTGKKVSEEIAPLVSRHIYEHVISQDIEPNKIKRLWLHQANIQINRAIGRHVFNRETKEDELPMILAEYGNTGSSGVMIAFHKHHHDLHAGDLGVLCSFGAGYAMGSVLLKKL